MEHIESGSKVIRAQKSIKLLFPVKLELLKEGRLHVLFYLANESLQLILFNLDRTYVDV